jgi:hypothetical protein
MHRVPTVWQHFDGTISLQLKSKPATYVESTGRRFVPQNDESMIYAGNSRFYRLESFTPVPPNPLAAYLMEIMHDPVKSRMRILVPEYIDGLISSKGTERTIVKDSDWLYSLRHI